MKNIGTLVSDSLLFHRFCLCIITGKKKVFPLFCWVRDMRIADVISTVLYEYVIFNTVDTVLAMYEYLQLVQFVFTIC